MKLWKTTESAHLCIVVTRESAPRSRHVYCFGATHKEQLAAISLIERNPLRFAKLQWLSPEQIGGEIRNLLPKGAITLDAGMIDELKEYFGPQGKFPAVHIESGRVGI